jgi:hypothetical protein
MPVTAAREVAIVGLVQSFAAVNTEIVKAGVDVLVRVAVKAETRL